MSSAAGVTIREAQGSDAPRLTSLIIELGHPIDEPTVRRNLATLSAAGLLPLLAVSGDEIVGMCGLSTTPTVHRDAPVGRITILIVTEGHRGKGIGPLLVAEAEKRLAALGCKIVEVTSNSRRERAHSFYEDLGYERTSYRFMKRL